MTKLSKKNAWDELSKKFMWPGKEFINNYYLGKLFHFNNNISLSLVIHSLMLDTDFSW